MVINIYVIHIQHMRRVWFVLAEHVDMYTSCTFDNLGCSATRYATSPTRSEISNGPMNLDLNFQRFLNIVMYFNGDTFRNT